MVTYTEIHLIKDLSTPRRKCILLQWFGRDISVTAAAAVIGGGGGGVAGTICCERQSEQIIRMKKRNKKGKKKTHRERDIHR